MLRELSLSETSRSDLCPVGAAIVARMFALATHGDRVSVSACERFPDCASNGLRNLHVSRWAAPLEQSCNFSAAT
jgi:hypothetical protein